MTRLCRCWKAIVGGLLTLLVLTSSGSAQPPPYDLVLRGGTVVDGSGAGRYRADVAISGDRIVRIAPGGLNVGSGRVELDATGLVVAPGFVDHHSHIATDIHLRPLAENFLFQGITTISASLHSGDMPWPLGAYIDSLRTAPNIAFFVGHSWVRRQVLVPPVPDARQTFVDRRRGSHLARRAGQRRVLGCEESPTDLSGTRASHRPRSHAAALRCTPHGSG